MSTQRTRIGSLFLGLLVLLSLSGCRTTGRDKPATASERYTLKVTAKSGDWFTHHREETIEIFTTEIVGTKRTTYDAVMREVLIYEEQIFTAEDGDPTRVRHTFRQWWKELKPKGARPRKDTYTLQGKTLVLRKRGNETAYEGTDEGVPFRELARNQIGPPEPFLNSLPRESIPVGHEWSVGEECSRRAIPTTMSGDEMRFETVKAKATGRFIRVEERKGEKCAVIEFAGEAESTSIQPAGLKMKLRYKATIFLGLDSGRPYALDLSGTATVDGAVEHNGQASRTEGVLKISIKDRNEFK